MRRIFKDQNLQEEYDKKGFVLFQLFNEPEIQEIISFFERNQVVRSETFYTSIWIEDEAYRRSVNEFLSSVYKRKLDHMLIEYRQVFCNYMIKPNSDQSQIGLHQDWTFVDEEIFEAINIWSPMVNTDASNGALKICAQSKKFETVVRGRFLPSPFQDLSEYILENWMTTLDVNKGWAVAFDTRTLHASGLNLSDEVRIATSQVVIPDEAELLHYVYRPEIHRLDKLKVDTDFFTKYGLSDTLESLPVAESTIHETFDFGLSDLEKKIST